MTEKDIFQHLLKIAPQSDDTDGVVTSCLVRSEEIIADAVSAGGEHAEYMLLQKIKETSITIHPEDIIYVTLQPCDRRTPGGEGEALGDCTSNVIKAGIKNFVYGATYPKSENSINRFEGADAMIRQVGDSGIIKACARLFNSTNADRAKHIPVPE